MLGEGPRRPLLVIVVLFLGATLLWFISEMIEGKSEFILHFGNVMLVTIVGAVLFPFWGWKSTGWVLASFGGLWFLAGVAERLRR